MGQRFIGRFDELVKSKELAIGDELSINQVCADLHISRELYRRWRAPNGIENLPKASIVRRVELYFGVPFYKIWSLTDIDGHK